MAVKACIFDFDGTLGDSMWVWEAVGIEFYEKRGIEYDASFCSRLAQLGLAAGAKDLVDRYCLDERAEDIVAGWQEEAEAKYATSVILKPGAEEYLRELKACGIKIAVATAQQRKALELALRNEGVHDFFDAILTTGEVTEAGKSTPEVYWAAARMLNEQVDDCLVFEDVLGPAKQAHEGGFRVVGVFDEHPSQDHEALRDEVDRYIESYVELLGSDPDSIVPRKREK